MTGKRYVSYTLGIETPETIDADTMAEIEDGAQIDETLERCIQRWLGGAISDAESRLADDLPEGWRVSVIHND